MSIKSFLQDLNQVFQEKEEEKRKRDELAQQRDKDRKAFFELYSNSYNGVVKNVKKIEKEAKDDFKVRYKKAPERSSSSTLEANLTFQPKFVSEVYEVRVAVKGNYKEKTLSIMGIAAYRLSAKHKTPIEVFNDNIQLFDPEQTEDYITNILRYFFIQR